MIGSPGLRCSRPSSDQSASRSTASCRRRSHEALVYRRLARGRYALLGAHPVHRPLPALRAFHREFSHEVRTVSMEFHPFSEVFPPLPDDELAELAADIKSFGLREAIWL